MKWSLFGRAAMALFSALALGLGMTACGGGTIAYIWTVGTQYNQIAGYKVDDYTGNLTAVQNSPFATNGSAPVYILVKPGGRYVYVINQGTTSTPTSNATDSGIAVFAVGGDGALTYQQSYQSQGYQHLWAQFDSTGNYLFVLDRYAPDKSGLGSITTFLVNATTGRLQLQPQTASTPSGGVAPNFLDVGQNPLTMFSSGSCLFTINQADQTLTPYQVANGQLTLTTTGKFPTYTANMTSINGNANYLTITDAGPTQVNNGVTSFTTPGTLSAYTVGSGCGLTAFTGSPYANPSTASDPVYSYIDTSNRYVFVLNKSNPSTSTASSASSISVFNINTGTTLELAPNATPTTPAGSGPVCMVEDPTQRYIYTSDQIGGTVTGYFFTNTQGTLSNLSRGSKFVVNDTGLQCLAISGSVY